MKKMKLIAAFTALIAGLAIFQFVRELSKPQVIPHTSVVVAAVDIAENTEIQPEMLEMASIVTEALLPGYYTDKAQIVGKVMKSDLYAGEMITSNRLISVGEAEDKSTTLAYLVEPGMRAVSLPVNQPASVTCMVKPGNHVDLVLSYNYERQKEDAPKGTMEDHVAVKYLLQDVTVLAVAQEVGRQGLSEYSIVTLQLSPEDCLKLIYADNSFGLRMVLRSSLDEEITDLGEIDLDVIKEVGND